MNDDDATQPDQATEADGWLGPDHPFARLVAHDPKLTRAMSEALRVLQTHAGDDRLKQRIGAAAAGDLSFADLLGDQAFTQTFTASQASEDALTKARQSFTPEQTEAINRSAAEHVARITDDGALIDQVRRAFGPLAD